MSRRRLEHEFKELNNDKSVDGTVTLPDPSNIYKWKLYMIGPKDTPYENGHFVLESNFSSDHLFKPPTIRFITRIFHPNISPSGDICIDILKNNWSPVLTMTKVMVSLQSLLAEPNPHDPLDVDSAELFLNDRSEFNEKASHWTKIYAYKR